MKRLIDSGCADQETLNLLEQAILDVAQQAYGDVRITLKGGVITHVSVTHSYTTKKGGLNPDPHFRSNKSKNER